MSVSIVYADWWEAFYKNGTTYQVYGRTSISIPSWDNVETTWEDYFDCTWFTSSTYVLWAVLQVENTGNSSSSVSIRADVRSWSTTLSTPVSTTVTISAWVTRAFKFAVKYSTLQWHDDLSIRFMAWDLDGIDTNLYTFDIYTPPWWIDCYSWIWKGLMYWGGLLATFYENDMDQTISSLSALNTYEPYNRTSTFDLSLCGVWSGVWCFAVYWNNTYWTSKTLSSMTLHLQAYKNWIWVDRKTKTLSWSISSWWYRWGYFEFNVLPWEIWTDATSYRVTGTWYVWDDAWSINDWFTISGLDIDDTTHEPWYMWVEWNILCYTDWYWYKHRLGVGNVGTYVWQDKAWYIRLDSDAPLCLSYISNSWIIYQTSHFSHWYWWSTNVWSSNGWYMWVSSGTTASSARYSLCLVTENWNKMRIINNWIS